MTRHRAQNRPHILLHAMAMASVKLRWWVVVLLACCAQALYLLIKTGGGQQLLLEGDVETELHRLTQTAAMVALKQLLGEGAAFDTEFSTKESVLTNGFPLSWRPCTLRPLLMSLEGEPLHIVVLGGSSSAHSAKNCSHDTTTIHNNTTNNDPYAGRYSNILMQQLFQDFFSVINTENGDSMDFDIINMAQGATDSVWSALMLDELINTQNTTRSDAHATQKVVHGADLIIVEYGINDALGGTTKLPLRSDLELAQMMNLWLLRVHSLFQFAANRKPPPILFVYLWDANFYYKRDNETEFHVNRDHLLKQGVGQTAWKAQQRVIEHYRNLGWSIGVANVGGIINNTAVANDPGILLDDKHHPNCVSMHVITAMIRHAIYSDLAHCPVGHGDVDTTTVMATQIEPMKLEPKAVSPSAADLMKALLNDTVKVGSIMEWEPNVGSSTLKLGHDSDFFNVSERETSAAIIQTDFGTKSFPWRADRKKSFTLSPCVSGNDNSNWQNQQQHVHFTLLEPQLQWLGVGYHIFHNPGTTVVIEMRINGTPIYLTNDDKKRATNRTVLEFDSAQIVKDWIQVSEYVPPQQQQSTLQYSLSFCFQQERESKPATYDSDNRVEDDCPFANATSIHQVCEFWALDNFDAALSCPYGRLETVTEACFFWWETFIEELELQLEELEQDIPAKNDPSKSPSDFLPPQLNWIVGVVRT